MNQIVSHDASPTQHQLALDIFHALDATNSPITDAKDDFHLRKSSLLVDVSDVGLLARRVLNGAYFLAQHEPDAEVHKTETMVILTCQQCGSPLPDAEPIQAFLEFDTAWSPPIPVIEKLASMFPDHTFELKYFEGGIGFSGHARWSEGIEEFHHQYEYDGPRGG